MTKFRNAMLPTIATVCIFWAAVATAQVHTGSIAGVVRDKAGAVVPNATVTAKNSETGAERTVQSNAEGSYNILALPPGSYDVTVTSGNFAPFTQKAAVTVGGTATVDATLGVSGGATSVEVTAEAAAVEVNTQTQEQSQIITPEQVAELPSLTRNPYDFIALAGNVSGGDRSSQSGNPQTSGGGQNNTDRGVGFFINGQRSSGTEILMDGVENTNLFDTSIALEIPQDAIQEFRVVTNNFDAQYGRASGGVVNVSTKSGTNNLHGSAWEYQPSLGVHREHLRQRRERHSQGPIHPQSVRIHRWRSNHQEQAVLLPEHRMAARAQRCQLAGVCADSAVDIGRRA